VLVAAASSGENFVKMGEIKFLMMTHHQHAGRKLNYARVKSHLHWQHPFAAAVAGIRS
jgi:hypothetical protein